MSNSTNTDSVELEIMPDGEASTEGDNLTHNRRPVTLPIRRNSSEDTLDFRDPTPKDKILLNVLQENDGQQQTSSSKSPFADRQNFVRQLCDASLLAANVSQLRVVLDGGSDNTYYIPLLLMIGFSLFFHIGFGMLMIHRWKKERKAELFHKTNYSEAGTPSSNASVLTEQANGVTCSCSSCLTVERCDEISMYIMLIIVVLNVFIAGLGLSGPPKGGAN
ncbi:ninjurin-1-like [Saccostrea echinata]|uniref:ninjurin-1-like n=1 Tax=Saccostrea echinata TaxID=191078 RepID=UPI002A80F284|nr:ninjurin-1-like [Saccostrea echinata]